jgi:hypothetical protein
MLTFLYFLYIFKKTYLGTIFCSINILQMTTILVQKSSNKFVCEKCNYHTCRKSQYERHNSSTKHQNNMDILQNTTIFVQPVPDYICENCSKIYKHHSSLWNHKKKCNNGSNHNHNHNNNDKLLEIIVQQSKDNKGLQELLIEQNKLITEIIKKDNTNTNINCNNINKTFNLNVFLNEHCKDAMNIMDFVESLKLQLSDLVNVGKVGYVNGISELIIKNLKAIDIHKRPVHCSDSKREVMYIKDDDKWEKENEEKHKLRKAIKHIAHKNSKMCTEFKEKYPDCIHSNSTKADQYNKIVIEAMGGSGDNDIEKEDKIIKKISKEVLIDKV